MESLRVLFHPSTMERVYKFTDKLAKVRHRSRMKHLKNFNLIRVWVFSAIVLDQREIINLSAETQSLGFKIP